MLNNKNPNRPAIGSLRSRRIWLPARGGFLGMAVTAAFVASTACSADGATAGLSSPPDTAPIKKMQLLSEQIRKPNVIRIYSKDRKGVIQTDLETAGATFVDTGYDTVLFNVGAIDKKRLVMLAGAELDASRQVILDSDGSESEIRVLRDVALALAGGGAPVAGIRIVKIQEGLMEATPIETEAEYRRRESVSGRSSSRGNTARHLFGME